MNEKISGLFCQPGLKRLQMQVASIAIASGFVFSGAADYAKLSQAEPPHQMTDSTEAIIEQISSSQTTSQVKVLHQTLEIQAPSQLSGLDNLSTSEEESQANLLLEKHTELLKNFVRQLQELLATLDLEKALDSDGQQNLQNSFAESTTEKINAENKTNKTNPPKPAESEKTTNSTSQAPDQVQTTSPQEIEIETEPQTVEAEEETQVQSYPLSVPTISQKTTPEDIKFDENGIPLNYTRVIEGKASAYSNDPITATGTKPIPGSVAVNPRNIPYGTKLWIVSTDGKYTYGYAVAEDTGGFIYWNNGPIVDLYMNTSSECYNFGVRNVKMYVLG